MGEDGPALAFARADDPLAPGFRVPALPAGTAHLWLMPRADAEPRWRALLAAYAELPQPLVVAQGAHGKPGLADSDLRFSLSRTPSELVIAIARGHELGVDLEWLGRRIARPEGLLRRCFGTEERAAIAAAPDARAALLAAWCAKEAVVKGIGRGIAFGLRRVRLSEGGASVRAGAGTEHWHVWPFQPDAGLIGALACRERLALEGFCVA